MKHSNIFKYVAGVAVLGFMTSCNDFLDQEPMSSVSPEKYLKDESQLEAYANKLYTDILPGHAYGISVRRYSIARYLNIFGHNYFLCGVHIR